MEFKRTGSPCNNDGESNTATAAIIKMTNRPHERSKKTLVAKNVFPPRCSLTLRPSLTISPPTTPGSSMP